MFTTKLSRNLRGSLIPLFLHPYNLFTAAVQYHSGILYNGGIMMLKPQDKVSVGLVSALSSLLLVDESLFLCLYTIILLCGSTFSLLIRSLITLLD